MLKKQEKTNMSKQWEKEFDEQFYNDLHSAEGSEYAMFNKTEEVKRFIDNKLAALRKKIEEKKVNQSNEERENPLLKHKWWFNNGYDSAIDDILQIIDEL